jgi:hypothetical protein
MFDWLIHYHDAIEALASASSLVVAFAAVFVAWRSPAIAAQFARREYAKQVRENTRTIVTSLRRSVSDVSDDVKTLRECLAAHKAQAPDTSKWASFHDAMALRLPAPLDFIYQLSVDIDQAQVAPYSDFAQRVRDYNNKRFHMQNYERDSAYSNWPAYWGELQAMLKRLAASAEALSNCA